MCFGISLSITDMTYENDKSNENAFLFDTMMSQVSWDKTDYMNWTDPPTEIVYLKYFRIYINDDNVNYTWSKTAAENDWCNGSGTYADPYVIENIYCYGNNTGGFIWIENSKKYFIIRNCWFEYGGSGEFDDGVFTRYVENGTIEDNIFAFTGRGVFLEWTTLNITVSNNFMISDHHSHGYGHAIHIHDCHNLTIKDNKIKNFYCVLYNGDSHHILIDSNYIEDTIRESITTSLMVFTFSNYYSVVRNTFVGAFEQSVFTVNEDENCDGNVIENNIIATYTEPVDFGPYSSGPQLQQASGALINLQDSDYNTIAYNKYVKGGAATTGAIPGYEPILIIGIISVISIIILKRHMKQ